jgi:hypothetical protein
MLTGRALLNVSRHVSRETSDKVSNPFLPLGEPFARLSGIAYGAIDGLTLAYERASDRLKPISQPARREEIIMVVALDDTSSTPP